MKTDEKETSSSLESRHSSLESGHAWKGSWDRPMHLDERGVDPFTLARMTDHNVRGPTEEDQPRLYPTRLYPSGKVMKKNVGSRERYGRIAFGILSGIGAVFLPLDGVVRVMLGIIGLAGLGTGVSRYCPLNRLIGINNFSEPRPESVAKKSEGLEQPPKAA